MLKGTHKNLRARKLAKSRGEKSKTSEGEEGVKSEESEKMIVVLCIKKHTHMYA